MGSSSMQATLRQYQEQNPLVIDVCMNCIDMQKKLFDTELFVISLQDEIEDLQKTIKEQAHQSKHLLRQVKRENSSLVKRIKESLASETKL